MRKKTEPQTQKHSKTSRTGAIKKGLTAKEETILRSAREECALDDRSHRTPKDKARKARARNSKLLQNMPGFPSP